MENYFLGLQRRSLLSFGIGAVTAAGLAGNRASAQAAGASQPASSEAPKLEFLMEVAFDIGGAHSVGDRTTVAVTGGKFEGPKLKGTVLTPGGDWLVRRPDGTSVLDVRATLQTDDQQLIYMSYRGIMYTPKGGKQYWRTIPMFETGAEKFAWLNHIVCVGTGIPTPGKAVYRVFEVL
jgi:hypothetical protein